MADRTRRNPPPKAPITSHPLFPVIVVLWCGALFGLASVAIRPALVESVVLATGIHRVVPMAAPPLGNTMRLLLTLLATGLGCLVGLLVARRLSRPRQQTLSRRRRDAAVAEAESPVSLFGGTPVDEPDKPEEIEAAPAEPRSVRRRQLAALAPLEDAVEERAPLPGQILKVAELGLNSFDDPVDSDAWLHVPARQDEEAVAPARGNRLFEVHARAPSTTSATTSAAAPTTSNGPSPGFTLLPRVEALDTEIAAETPTQVETFNLADDAPSSEVAEPAPFAGPYATAADRIAYAPLDALSHVELLERLAQTIARRRAGAGGAAKPAAASEPREGPAAPRHIGMAAPDLDTADDDLANGYASLRDFSRREQRQEFVSLEQEDRPAPQPVLAFPSHEPAPPHAEAARAFDAPHAPGRSPDDTDRALRAALATLQRMSGAA